ncbi:helix-turn-helix domain-containing protein [Rahnella victoriana]|nr:helix-turn-helix domain-containing protein [Rahnella victoriana]
MRLENAVAADVLERILSAYGFTMQKELSDKLGIAKSNVASWLQRGQVPGNVLVQCALDTGTDIRWLVTGEFANANANANKNITYEPARHSLLHGQPLITKMLRSGGKAVLQRILEAYGFKTQKELSEYLGISTGTISTWVRREFFPGDVVIACALETGVSLAWLSIGDEEFAAKTVNFKRSSIHDASIIIDKYFLNSGDLISVGDFYVDNAWGKYVLSSCVYVEKTDKAWILDKNYKKIVNGKWLIAIDGVYDIYSIVTIPGRKVKIQNITSEFECSMDEVEFFGFVKIDISCNERYF